MKSYSIIKIVVTDIHKNNFIRGVDMKDVNVKNLGSNRGYGVYEINNKVINISSDYGLISSIYNEIFGTNMSFKDIVIKYLKHTTEDNLNNILESL